jgi:hypothetical protein
MRLRRPTRTTLGAFAGLAVLAVLGVGCGGDDDASTPPTSAPITTTTAAVSSTFEPGLDEEGIAALEELLPDLLVSESELGDASYVDVGYSPGAGPGPCGLDVDASIPPSALAGTNLASEPLASSVQEEIRVYGSADESRMAFRSMVDASSCVPARDVRTETGADEATAFPWEGGTVIVARVADTVLTFAVSGQALDHLEVAAFGVGRVLAALEAPSG